MAGSVNKVILVGNVGKDPEIRTTQNGGKIDLLMALLLAFTTASASNPEVSVEWI